jgi:catechol 2,3-dioxygenase-like lactoylglutathione lyase family enzyme
MPLVDISGCHHLRLTVSDIARSRAFYTEVLGFQVLAESPGDPSDPAVRADQNQLYGGIVMLGGNLVLGLRPVAPADDRFDPDRVGLDHLSFNVASRAVLEETAQKLSERGVVHGQVTDLTGFGIAVLSLDDPDGIQLELTAPL